MAYKNSKAEHAFQTFHRDLNKNNFENVIFMYGEEEYLTEWACNSLAAALVDPSVREIDFVKIEEAEDADQLLTACDTFSMFSEKRVVWAKDFPPLLKKNAKGFGEGELKKLLDYIKDPNKETVLIFSCVKPDESSSLVKQLKKQHKIYFFDKLDRPQLSAFAEKRFAAAGKDIDRAVLRYLIDETGYFNRESEYRIFNLENDIKKIIAYSGENRITEEDIDATIKGDLDKFAFDFLDAVTSGHKDKALRLLNNIIGSGGEIYSVLGLLISQFELMTEAKELYQSGEERQEIPRILKVNPYRAKKAMAYGDKFSMNRLKDILSQFYQADRNIKTGMIDQNLALELIIGRM